MKKIISFLLSTMLAIPLFSMGILANFDEQILTIDEAQSTETTKVIKLNEIGPGGSYTSEMIVNGKYLKVVITEHYMSYYDEQGNLLLRHEETDYQDPISDLIIVPYGNQPIPRGGFAWTPVTSGTYSIKNEIKEGVEFVVAALTAKLNFLAGYVIGKVAGTVAEEVVSALQNNYGWQDTLYYRKSQGWYSGCEILGARKEDIYKDSARTVWLSGHDGWSWNSTPWDYTQPSLCRELEANGYPY